MATIRNKDWGKYQNGNYTVAIDLTNGTKIRYNNEDRLIPSTIENFDYKITSRCDGGCPFCFESSTINGKHGDIMNHKFIDNLHPYTEIAIGGGNPLCHPQLVPFLKKCQELKLIPSLTVNQMHFEKSLSLLQELVDEKLIYGLGVSLTDPNNQFIEKVQQFPNAVIHVINGVITEDQLNAITNHDLKILILGYKEVGKGKSLYQTANKTITARQDMLRSYLPSILKRGFKVVSFDNRALQQLDVKSIIPQDQWDLYFMGDDGLDGNYSSSSMFVDGVTGKFALNSCSSERFPIKDTIEEMFKILQEKYSKSC